MTGSLGAGRDPRLLKASRNGLPLLLFLSPFLMDGSMAMFNFALPYYGDGLGLNDLEIGLAKGAATLPYVLICVLAGSLSDRVGRRRIALIGSLGIAIWYVLVPCATGLLSLMAVCACIGATQAFYWSPLQGWIGDTHSGTGLSRALMRLNLAWSSGIMLGLLAGGYLFSVSARALYWTAALTAVGAAIVLRCGPSGRERSVRERVRVLPVPGPVHRRYLLAHRLANAVSYFCIATVLTYFQLRAKRDLGWPPAMAGQLVFVLGAVYVVMFPLMGTWTRWHYRPHLTLAAQALAFVGMLGLGWGESYPVLLPCLASVGLMLSISYASSLYYSVSSTESIGNKAGWHESVLRMGDFLGGVLGGAAAWLCQDIRAAFALAAGVVLAGGVACSVMLCRGPAIRAAVPEE